ncbi:MAG: hypothetical protein JJU36_16270 [Phycisphaeraceae bacterium]|nr:hypothetical protein [Phycisphaeraceae bacterium]
MIRIAPAILTVLIATTLATPLKAQTGPRLLYPPVPGQFDPEGSRYELTGDVLVIPSSRAKGSTDSFPLTVGEMRGRGMIMAPDRRVPAVYLGTQATMINGRLGASVGPSFTTAVDHSGAIGATMFLSEDWAVGGTFGVGHAGTKGYQDGKGVYFMADLMAGHQLSEHSMLIFGISYNGNRAIFPDIPLPGFLYTYTVSKDLNIAVGVPQSTVTWKPVDAVTLRLSYSIPVTIDVDVDVEIYEGWTLYGKFENRFAGFHESGQSRNQRIMVRQRRLEGGIRYKWDSVEVSIGGGFAFDQEVSRGFDIRGRRDRQSYADRPYIRAGVSIDF